MYIVVVEDARGALIGEYALDRELSVGRTPDNDIVLASDMISRSHARLFMDERGANISDMGSANGVIVDERRIDGPAPLTDSTQVRIGDFRLYLEPNPAGLRPSQDNISTAIVHPEQAHGKLVVVSGPQAGREHLLFEPVTRIGRTDENDVTLADASVSRHHARLKRLEDGGYTLNDLKSSNGTMLNDRPLSTAKVWHGDRVQFGNVECMLLDVRGKSSRKRPMPHWMLYAGAVVVAMVLGALVSWVVQ
ncbi:MAG: FHA domain-containing protein [Bradymonadia bacterium]